MGTLEKNLSRVEQVARLIRPFNRPEKVRLLQLVPELQTIPASEIALPPEQLSLMAAFDSQIPYSSPVAENAEFIAGLTIAEFFNLPEKEQAYLWQEAHDLIANEIEISESAS